jgi:transketolase
LAIDAIEKANSGHPGMPLGMADVATVLWLKYLKHNPKNPQWMDRDRFVLSAGHGSMLYYGLLHLSGYKEMTLDELSQFRQWGSKTPGHPEYEHTQGVETTTGPLGQGCANAVGMALSERMLAARLNSDDEIINHFTYVIASEGDFEEGASHEVFSFAGNHGLGKLILFYDQNFISIEGDTKVTYTDDVEKRMNAYGWHVQEIDGHNYDQIDQAIERAQAQTEQPSIIICNTTIGYGAPTKAGTASSHGSPLGESEAIATKQILGLPEQTFYVPETVQTLFDQRSAQWADAEIAWQERYEAAVQKNPDTKALWNAHMSGTLPVLEQFIPVFEANQSMATRAASGEVLQHLSAALPQLVGGSADLAPSNNTRLNAYEDIARDSFSGRNIHFGVRELGMAGIMNGMHLHGGFRVFGGTFLVFADFLRPAARLAALMKVPVMYVLTHDSFCVGEDGPTHQPIETCASLRLIHNLNVLRPADANEVREAWMLALERQDGPSALLLTRQPLKTVDRTICASASGVRNGAYILWESSDQLPDLILMASGSEVELILEAAQELAKAGVSVRVVSMPCWELFEQQSAAYKEQVLPASCEARLAVEAGSRFGWERYIGMKGDMISKDDFGASAPYKVLMEQFGFTVECVVEKAKSLL